MKGNSNQTGLVSEVTGPPPSRDIEIMNRIAGDLKTTEAAFTVPERMSIGDRRMLNPVIKPDAVAGTATGLLSSGADGQGEQAGFSVDPIDRRGVVSHLRGVRDRRTRMGWSWSSTL